MTTKSTEESFFEGKRPWSVIKDQVIGSYIPPFVNKVAKLQRPILLIDAFAGPGKFDDNSPGSPLIICSAASQAKAQWRAVFINSNKAHHDKLTAIITSAGWAPHVTTKLGDSAKYLEDMSQQLKDETIFLYLDPFGLKGCNFRIIEAYLKKASDNQSVEIVVNMSMPTLHRLATRQAVAGGKGDDPQIDSLNKTLSRVLGGNWWQEIMWTETEPMQKEEEIMQRYVQQLQVYLPITGYCPVRESATSSTKYYITFASRHPDARPIMNDIMCRAYEKYVFTAHAGQQATLWNWEEGRDFSGLRQTILETLHNYPNRSRQDIWELIVQDHFMQWLEKDYNATLTRLLKEEMINYQVDPKTRRRNSNSLLSLRH